MKLNIPAGDPSASLSTAIKRLRVMIEGTRTNHNPEKIEDSPAFGIYTCNIWMLPMLVHEVDHLRQIAAMRGLAHIKEME